ncbi:hypothetical protein D9M72_223010 [compost metagenome]
MLADQVFQVQALPFLPRQFRFHPRHGEQLVDHPGQAVDALGQEAQGLGALLVAGGFERVLRVQAQHRQRRAHLVGGVADEAPFALQHLFDLRQQAVDRRLHGFQLPG